MASALLVTKSDVFMFTVMGVSDDCGSAVTSKSSPMGMALTCTTMLFSCCDSSYRKEKLPFWFQFFGIIFGHSASGSHDSSVSSLRTKPKILIHISFLISQQIQRYRKVTSLTTPTTNALSNAKL